MQPDPNTASFKDQTAKNMPQKPAPTIRNILDQGITP
jgi:hypothetical protein